mmetsp:Transcript_1193/g.4272  ORF Transcript_1193/g.4272 Transcript_1193/m.4272 type:complete len:457 (-) Transcript_1193:47-1417(-)
MPQRHGLQQQVHAPCRAACIAEGLPDLRRLRCKALLRVEPVQLLRRVARVEGRLVHHQTGTGVYHAVCQVCLVAEEGHAQQGQAVVETLVRGAGAIVCPEDGHVRVGEDGTLRQELLDAHVGQLVEQGRQEVVLLLAQGPYDWTGVSKHLCDIACQLRRNQCLAAKCKVRDVLVLVQPRLQWIGELLLCLWVHRSDHLHIRRNGLRILQGEGGLLQDDAFVHAEECGARRERGEALLGAELLGRAHHGTHQQRVHPRHHCVLDAAEERVEARHSHLRAEVWHVVVGRGLVDQQTRHRLHNVDARLLRRHEHSHGAGHCQHGVRGALLLPGRQQGLVVVGREAEEHGGHLAAQHHLHDLQLAPARHHVPHFRRYHPCVRLDLEDAHGALAAVVQRDRCVTLHLRQLAGGHWEGHVAAALHQGLGKAEERSEVAGGWRGADPDVVGTPGAARRPCAAR